LLQVEGDGRVVVGDEGWGWAGGEAGGEGGEGVGEGGGEGVGFDVTVNIVVMVVVNYRSGVAILSTDCTATLCSHRIDTNPHSHKLTHSPGQ
jgi:hypothetical protein